MSGKEKLENIVKEVMKYDISDEERLNKYNEWIDSYEQDLEVLDYTGPKKTAETTAECFHINRENIAVIDIAAGTGLVGQELYKLGFRTMDALDPSQKMLNSAKKKSIYRNFICEYVTEKPLDIPENSYDALTICGGMGNGHLPCGALYEIIRLVKPGGYVIFVTRHAHLSNAADYKDRLEPLMDQLETERKWKQIKKEVFSNYLMGLDGVTMVYQIC